MTSPCNEKQNFSLEETLRLSFNFKYNVFGKCQLSQKYRDPMDKHTKPIIDSVSTQKPIFNPQYQRKFLSVMGQGKTWPRSKDTLSDIPAMNHFGASWPFTSSKKITLRTFSLCWGHVKFHSSSAKEWMEEDAWLAS